MSRRSATIVTMRSNVEPASSDCEIANPMSSSSSSPRPGARPRPRRARTRSLGTFSITTGPQSIAAAVSLLISAAFAAASIIIIGTTIRLTVMQRSQEIAIMRLVGATSGFIRFPFLLEGAFKGALGGLLAVGLSFAAFLVVSRLVLQGRFFTPVEALAFVAAGLLLGLLSSAMSVGRHLQEI